MDIKILELKLGTGTKLPPSTAGKIRGYIGNTFAKDPTLHNHKGKGGFFYRYPMVQYKILNGDPLLLGIENGIDSLWNIFDELFELWVNNDKHEILDKNSLLKKVTLGIADSQIHYHFLTPWLALNERNYERYQRLGVWAKRKELLEKILVGNIISMSKGLGYTVPEPIKANISNLREVKTSLKSTPMLGFLGSFAVNFEIPDYWGIGKSVSRGFGTVVKQTTEYRRQIKEPR